MMDLPLQIVVRNTLLSESEKEEIREKASKLDRHNGDIIRCRVTVVVPHRHHRKGALYDVRIDLTVAGAKLVIRREPNEALSVAIRDSFDAARRQLEEFNRHRSVHGSFSRLKIGPEICSEEEKRERERYGGDKVDATDLRDLPEVPSSPQM